MGKQRCEGCRWFLKYTSQDIGQCRRYPPTQNTETGWLEVSHFDWCGEWQDKNITPEQAERQELVKQFALAIVEGMYANPDDVDVNVVRQAQRFADNFVEAFKEGQR